MAFLYMANLIFDKAINFRPCKNKLEMIISVTAKYTYNLWILTLDTFCISLLIGILSISLKQLLSNGRMNKTDPIMLFLNNFWLTFSYIFPQIPMISFVMVVHKLVTNNMVIIEL